jgi:hypothetical protein
MALIVSFTMKVGRTAQFYSEEVFLCKRNYFLDIRNQFDYDWVPWVDGYFGD